MDRRKFFGLSAATAGLLTAGRANKAKAQEMIFKDIHDLTRLDYFEKNAKDQLVLCEGVAEKIIDMHTHLGIKLLSGSSLDLDREDDEAPTLFPDRGDSIDLSEYSPRSFSDENQKISQTETVKQAFPMKGYSDAHTPKNLIKEMDKNYVTHSVILAIDFHPGINSHNSKTFMEASKKHERLIPFVSVHPKELNMERKVRDFREQGAVGMKIHPPMQFIYADSKDCMKMTKLCGELNMPCLFHSGSSDIQPRFQDKYCRIEHWWKPVQEQPETTFILAHGGIYYWKELIELAKANDNVWIELSGQPPAHIKEMIDAGLEDRIMFGSDWPFYVEALPLVKVLVATEGAPDVREKVLYKNAQRLLGMQGVTV